jgi:DNA-binding response OmpR family regulator
LGSPASGAYRLVLLDLALPGDEGMDVVRRMIAARPEQEVVVVSAQSEVETKVRCLDIGAVDYVTKPVTLAELLACVRRRLAGTGSERVLRSGRSRWTCSAASSTSAASRSRSRGASSSCCAT